MSTAVEMTGRPTTPIPGQATRTPYYPRDLAANGKRKGQQNSEVSAAPERAVHERARRSSGSPEPGSAARSNWQLGGNGARRAPMERARETNPISGSAARRLSPSSPKVGPQQARLPQSPVATSWGWRPKDFAMDISELDMPGSNRPDASNEEVSYISEEQIREFEASSAKLKDCVFYLRGWLKTQEELHPECVRAARSGYGKSISPDAPRADARDLALPPPDRKVRSKGRENRSPRENGRTVASKVGANREEGRSSAWPRAKPEDVIAGANFIMHESEGVNLQNHIVGGC
mmetsp:Transcript_28420/g.51332  ORF Transcript_28420/g.51332 Transcript_28420/m.51332 type:complete len:291 (-) Transcript_28420:89-961(-)